MIRASHLFPSVAAVLFAASPALAASWQPGNYGGNLTMTYYVPDNVDENPALLLALHFCSGNETSGQNWFRSFADEHGFVIISPKAPGNCWDSAPGRSGDRAQIAQMIDWAVDTLNVDPTRVYSAGASSGACMSQTMLASYPDKIAAAAVLAGVPVGFWSGGNECGVCGNGTANSGPVASASEDWPAKVIAAGPAGFTGSRGRIQLFHASLDEYLSAGNFDVEVTQWTGALDVVGEGVEEANTPFANWTRTSYKNAEGVVVVQANWLETNQNRHDLTSVNPSLWSNVISFFGLDQEPPDPTTSEPAPTTGEPSEPAPTTEPPTTDTPTTGPSPTTTIPGTDPIPTNPPNPQPTTTPQPTATPEPTTNPPATTSPDPTTTAPGTDTNTAPGTGTTGPTTNDDGDDASCQCRVGTAGRPTGALAGLLAVGLAAVLRRRRS